MIKPRALVPGDTIGVVSPASSIDNERLQKGLDLIRSRGYNVKTYPHVLDTDYYLAGNDQSRAADLMAAFADPDCAAVLCSRGGYGCARLLPLLDLDEMAKSGKMFMGFSDITTLHLALNRRGLVTFHTPMALTLAYEREPWVHESFFNLLAGDATIPVEASKPETVVPGIAEGVLTGGCLCLLCDSIATRDPLETSGKLLLIEDVDENPHRIDAMMTHLFNIGLMQSCAGIIVGEMTNTDDKCDPTMGAKPWREIISERLIQAGVSSVLGFPFGHMKTMLSVPLGISARLNATDGTLEYLESPCS
ncbi:MAG: LD-carboxypeptidase [Armatimonadetes bacterium]|nr:LD-carboxypeptidase [Armatimonadota bacterium]